MSHNATSSPSDQPPGDPGQLQQSLVLLRAAQTGDREALDQLLARYQDRILRIVRLRMGPRLRRNLESVDLMNEVMLTAARNYERFEVREESSLIYWLSRIVENEARQQAEFHGRQRRDADRLVPLSGVQPAAHVTEPDAEKREAREALERALDQLPERHRELIAQREYLGASWQAIADDLGYASPDVARVSHSRAVLALGKILRQTSRDDGGG